MPPVPPTEVAPEPKSPSNVPKIEAFFVKLSLRPTLVRGGSAPWMTKSNPGAAINEAPYRPRLKTGFFKEIDGKQT